MILRDLFKNPKIRLAEGGNLELPNPNDPTQPYQAQEIQLAPTEINDDVHDRTYMVGVLKQLLDAINKEFAAKYKQPLWDQKLLDTNIKEFMAGSSEHFFDLERPNPNFNPKQPPSELNPKMVGISDEEFKKYKPKVGDIDIQCNQELQTQLEEFLTGANHARIGNATFLGFSRGSEQYNGLFQFDNPPIKLQLDFEYGRYAPETNKPAEWTKFSHSSSWEDIQQNIKGVFHKYIYRALAKAVPTEKYIAKLTGLGKNRKMAISGPVTDANFSFAVASKGGGGIRAKYKPYIDPETNSPKLIDGLPVMEPLKSEDSEYIQDLNKQFQLFFGEPPTGDDRTLQNSFVGTLELMNRYLDDSAKRKATVDFLSILFEPGGQMITKNDPARDYDIKFAAVNKMLATLGLEDMQADAEAQSQAYIKDFQDVEAYKKANPGEKQPRAAMLRSRNAAPVTEAEEAEPQVKAQLRKGMPHLRDLKPTDLLDLLDEIHDGNGNFKLQNIPLNVKVDGFGGRFGKNADGKPFMGTSRTEPRYQAGFVDYHQKKGTTDPEILGRAQLFDDLFNEMMKAVKLVDSKLGQDFLINKQVTCEVLYIPFATETDEGKLKFVGIHYDKLPEGVQLALVPFRVVDATTGEDLLDAQDVVKQLTSVGQAGSVMFIDNSLTQNEALDVTALVPPVENIEQLKAMLASKKRDQAAEVKAALQPIALALEKAIIEDPNIIGKDLLGQDYEGIVINSRLGPIKVTSQEQRDVISAKNAAKAQVKASQVAAGDIPQTGNKTAVVAIGSFVGHIGHEELFDYTVKKAQEVGGDPYLFIGSAVGKDDPIPPNVKVQTWHKLYPEYASHISAVTQEGGTLMQKIKHELIQPRPGGQPRYDNIIIMVGEDREGMPIANALMKSVNKFAGYEHVKVSLEATPRGTGMSFSKLRNILKDPNATEEQQYVLWSQAFDVNKLGINWIKHLMDVTRKGMGIQQPQVAAPQPTPVAEQRLFNALVRPAQLAEDENVRRLQQLLIKKGAKIAADGIMGPLTRAAMKQFGVGGAPTLLAPAAPVARKPLAPSNPGIEKKIAGVVKSGPGYTEVNTTDGEIQRRVGSRNWRNNNPGNIRKGGYTQSKGAVGDDGEFAVFPTLEIGRSAKEELVFGKYYINLNLRDAITKYAPPSENDTEGYIRNVKQATGATDDTPLSKLNPEQRTLMLKAIEKVEGFKVGNINVVSNVAEQRLFNALVRPLKESTSIESTLKAIINDIGEPITNVYDTMKYQAKKYVDNHGELGRGFRMVAAGVGGRWVQGMYINKLQNELYDLCNYNTRRTVDLKDFLRGVEANGELDSKRSFGNIANELPEILAKIGQHLNAPQLTKNAQRWIQNKAAYEQYLEKLEAEVDGDDYDEPAQVKTPKSNIAGQQNAQADQIVNNVLKKLPTKIQGDIRNAISRSPNKLQALHAELLKRGVKMPMAEERMSAAVKLQRAWERERAKSDASLRRTPSSIPKPEPKKDEKGVAEGSEDLVQIEYWQQETMESGRWVKTKPIPRATAEKIVNSFERGEIVNVEQGVAEGESDAIDTVAKRLTDPKDGMTAKLRAAGDKRREDKLKGRNISRRDTTSKDEWGDLKELSNDALGRYKKAASADASAADKAVNYKRADKRFSGIVKATKKQFANDVNGQTEEKQRLDPSCWKGYRKAGTKMKGGVRVNNCVPVSENVENIMDSLINKIVVNEAIQNNRR